MSRRVPYPDDDAAPVIVPLNDKTLVAVSPERVRRLREHLANEMGALRKAKHPDRLASPDRPGPAGFLATVALSACSLCKGWCCRKGDDDAFLDDRTLARVFLARPEMTEQDVLGLYTDRVPPMAYRDSCIFHGKSGCTLDRSMRSDVCNVYYCGGLEAFMKSNAEPAPTVVIAGEGDGMRTSAVLVPRRQTQAGNGSG
jgi:hypothetical protein